MSKIKISLVFICLVSACVPQEDCMTIRDKRSSNGMYYFLNRSGDDLVNENVTVKQVSVSIEEYNRFSIGDLYCID